MSERHPTDWNQVRKDINDIDDDEELPRARPSGREIYPAGLKDRDWWVNWVRAVRPEEMVDNHPASDAVPTKQPIEPYNTGTAKLARWNEAIPDEEHPRTSFDTVVDWNGARIGHHLHGPNRIVSNQVGIGVILEPTAQNDDRPITLLDWDDVRRPNTEEIHPVCAWALGKLDGYAEISQSGEGIHQFVYGDVPGSLRQFLRHIDTEPFVGDDRPMIEMYSGTRLTAMTGRHVEGCGGDIVDGQDLINALCWRFGDGTNNSSDHPTGPFAGERTDGDRQSGDRSEPVPSRETVAEKLAEITTYEGPSPAGWEIPEGDSVRYQSVLRGWELDPKPPNVADWQLLGYAAAIGHELGKDQETVIGDLVEYEPERRVRREVQSVWRKAEVNQFSGPSVETLQNKGLLPESYEESGPTAMIPLERLRVLDDDEARRFAKRHGVEWPTTEEVRNRLEAAVAQTMANGERGVVDAPTSAGKSYQIAATPWRDVDDSVTGGAPVLHLHETKAARDEHAQTTADQLGEDAVRRLCSGFETCPIARGDHDPSDDEQDADHQTITVDGMAASEWFDEMVTDRGLPFSVVHAAARRRNDQDLPELPCSPGDQMCPSQSQYAGVPRNADGEVTADVIHATHPFGHVPSLRHSVNIVFDEQPDFGADITHDRAQRAVTAFLQLTEVGPDTWEELVSTARTVPDNDLAKPWNEHAKPGNRADREAFQNTVEALEHEPGRDWYLQQSDAHTLARPIARGVFNALYDRDAFDANGRATQRTSHNPPRFDDDARDTDFWNREWVSVVIDDRNRLRRVRAAPDLSGARSVIGLDAHPNERIWQRNTHPDMTRVSVLDPEERRRWRLYERNLVTVQVGDAVRPKGRNGQYYDRDGDAVLVDKIRDEFGDLRSGIVPKAVEEDYVELLEEAGADVPSDDNDNPHRVLTFGSEKSRNTLAGESVGFVSHCLDPGDEYLLDWLAECGLEAEPSQIVCPTCDGDGCRECNGSGTRREHGRAFDGSDADAAGEFLATVREHHLTQSAGRYARNPDDPTDGATVFVRSAALPDQFTDLQVSGVDWTLTDTQAEIVDALRQRSSATARELATETDVSRAHVHDTLGKLAETDDVEVREHVAKHGAHLYRATAGLPTAPGLVELEPKSDDDRTTNDLVWGTSTWALTVCSPTVSHSAAETPERPIRTGDQRGSQHKQVGLEAFDRRPPTE